MYKTILSILVCALLVVSCKKRVHKAADKWIGEWGGNGTGCAVWIIVDENSRGEWHKEGYSGCDTDVSGTVKIRGDVLQIASYRFDILEHPAPLPPGDSVGVFIGLDHKIATWRAKISCRSFHCEEGTLVIYR